jgi:hypothetical protein
VTVFARAALLQASESDLTNNTTSLALVVSPSAGCTGDCSGDGKVTVDELLTMMNIALGNAEGTNCLAGDADGDGLITVDEVILAVNNALNGCGSVQ